MISAICFIIIPQRGRKYVNEGTNETSLAMCGRLLKLEHEYMGVYCTHLSLLYMSGKIL